MFPILQQKLDRFTEIDTLLADPAVASDPSKAGALAKERGGLLKSVTPYQEFLRLDEGIKQSEKLLTESDADMRAMAEEELADLRPKWDALKAKIEEMLLVDPSEDFDRVIVEIRAGTGGDEAALFAGNLYEMYCKYARTRGWTVEDISFSPGDAGGFKEVVFGVEGEGAYQALRFESGGHRVQRVPATETQGRIHTSLATVGVMPEPDSVQIEIRDEDIEWDRMRAGGAGGQKVNKTESAVRIWYKKGTPEEMEVKCQDERSQHKNFDRAMRVLRSRLFERAQQKLHKDRADLRRSLIGGGERGERIRTYNFPDGRVTDHRIGLTVHKIALILAGELDHILGPLAAHDKQERLAAAAGAK